MATGVDSSHVFDCTVKTANPENIPERKNRLHFISVTSRVVAIFVFTYVTFRYCVIVVLYETTYGRCGAKISSLLLA